MKRNKDLRISIMPLILMIALSIVLPHQEKGHAQNNEKVEAKKADADNKKHDISQRVNNQANEKVNQGIKNNSEKSDIEKNQGFGSKNDNSGKGIDNGILKIQRGVGNSFVLNGKRDIQVNWDFSNFAMRRDPENQKKISICHKPAASGKLNSVNIEISQNALNSHLNHGDQIGDCKVNYSDEWSDNYIKSRQEVYTVYEQTYETITYSEALLKYAVEKLFGIRKSLKTDKLNLSSQEVQRREMLILDLQNNVNSLENQLMQSRQKIDSDVNIIVQM